jgi:hypothetical protein
MRRCEKRLVDSFAHPLPLTTIHDHFPQTAPCRCALWSFECVTYPSSRSYPLSCFPALFYDRIINLKPSAALTTTFTQYATIPNLRNIGLGLTDMPTHLRLFYRPSPSLRPMFCVQQTFKKEPAESFQRRAMPELSPFNGRCHKCNMVGHKQQDCRAGGFRFKCKCGHQFTSLCKGMNGFAPCYRCRRAEVSPSFPVPKDGERQSRKKHSCDSCITGRRCPVLAMMAKEAAEEKQRKSKRQNKQ